MAARPTISDVARAAGVSKGLVSFALNDRPGVAPGTRARILAVADDLGYRPSVPARALSKRTAYSVGLVIARDADLVAADPFYPSFIAGAERVLVPAGRSLTLTVLSGPGEEAALYRALADGRRVDGVFLSDMRPADDRLPLLAALGLPAVTLGATGDARFPAVSVDDGAGVAETVRHLADLGHRRLAIVTGPSALVHARRRTAAFEAAAASGGVAGRVVETDFSPAQAAEATRRLLAGDDRPTAILYGNDVAAAAGIAVAHRAGLRVPHDLSVCGFDDAELARWTDPALTTVGTRPGDWGEAAARALLALLDGGAVPDVDLGAARLVVRDSTGPAPAAPGRSAR